jgi:predicted ATPase
MASTPSVSIACAQPQDGCRLVVLTGGPGAGKTAILELARRTLCPRIAILPEAATILFGGGFLRHNSSAGKKSAQRAIFHVQHELERLVQDEGEVAFALCDRGTVDGLAYWPATEEEFFRELGTTHAAELSRYHAVIHLRTPDASHGYNHQNPLRTEDPALAHDIDERILRAWDGHPNRHIIDSTDDFMMKATTTMQLVQRYLPGCCQKRCFNISTASAAQQ